MAEGSSSRSAAAAERRQVPEGKSSYRAGVGRHIAIFAGVVLPLIAFFFAFQNIGDIKRWALRLLPDDITFSTAIYEEGVGPTGRKVIFSASNLSGSPVNIALACT